MDREDELDEEYDRLIILIQQKIVQMPKHQKIKMVAWIKKLDMPIKNEVWKQTRNLYAQVMFKMMQQDKIQSPFDKNPPEGSLPRLNRSDLPYPLRNKIANKSKSKLVNRNLTQRSLNVKQNITNNYKSFMETQQTKKPSKSPTQSKSQLNCTFKFSISDQISEGKESKRNITERKTNYEQCSKIRQELEQNKLCLVLKRTLKFLSKNYEVLCDQTQYSSLLQDIVMIGDQRKYNLRDINSDCNPSPTRTVFKKCIRKIQEQIEKTSQENQYYLNCLKECKPK